MPELLFKTPEELEVSLPEGHPALNKKGKLRKKALKVMNRRILPSRYEDGYFDEVEDAEGWPIRNTELFDAIADEIKYFPDSYNQDQWGVERKSAPTLCGTAYCVAGHAGHLTGWTPRLDEFTRDWDYEELTIGDGVFQPIEEIGYGELGLTEAEADILFYSGWKPKSGDVPKTLRAIGRGALISDITDPAICIEMHGWIIETLIDEEENRVEIRYTGENV